MATTFYSSLRQVPSENWIKAPGRLRCRASQYLKPGCFWAQSPLEKRTRYSGRKHWERRTATNLSAELEEEEEDLGGKGAEGTGASSQTEVDPYSLFPTKYFAEWSLGLALYFPFGCAIGSFRAVLWVLLLAVDKGFLSNNDAMIRVLQWILGANVHWHNMERLPQGRYVMISNHQTAGDLLSLYQLPHRIIHLVSAGIPKAATEVKNHRLRLWYATAEVFSELAEPNQEDPVHLFPEGGMTNGTGMMRFNRGFMKFVKDSPVVPVALRVSHPFEVNVHTLNSPFLANLLMFSFLPWVTLDATILEPVKKSPGEASSAFVKRVQGTIAQELQIPITSISLKDKRKLMKKYER